MKIKKEYNISKEGTYNFYTVNISIENDTGKVLAFPCKYPRYSIDDLSDEGFYEKNYIEYIIEVDNVTKQNNVIPLGMVELTNDGRQCRGDIFIDIGKVENLENAKKIINNIEKAIEIKHDNQKFIDLFNNGDILSIDLDPVMMQTKIVESLL